MTPLESLRLQLEGWLSMRRAMVAKDDGPAFRFLGNEDLVLQHGKAYTLSPDPPPVVPLQRGCFAQSYRLATRRDSPWIYVEGFAVQKGSLGLHVNHAWVAHVDRPDVAVDLAWEEPVDAAYIGIAFSTAYVRASLKKNEQYSVLDAWPSHYPLLTGRTRIEDVIWKDGPRDLPRLRGPKRPMRTQSTPGSPR